MAEADYSVHVEALAPVDGGGFLATVPELPGCMSDGKTAHQAERNVRFAIGEWIDRAIALGRPIPEPARQHLYA